jgi:hypothetical protein
MRVFTPFGLERLDQPGESTHIHLLREGAAGVGQEVGPSDHDVEDFPSVAAVSEQMVHRYWRAVGLPDIGMDFRGLIRWWHPQRTDADGLVAVARQRVGHPPEIEVWQGGLFDESCDLTCFPCGQQWVGCKDLQYVVGDLAYQFIGCGLIGRGTERQKREQRKAPGEKSGFHADFQKMGGPRRDMRWP